MVGQVCLAVLVEVLAEEEVEEVEVEEAQGVARRTPAEWGAP